ncbi:MAG: DUF5677 domain-containing protein [Pseudomonadota bacterium]|nr:DUF5677 domain-containing protein [Pseudomonadota bacterium]
MPGPSDDNFAGTIADIERVTVDPAAMAKFETEDGFAELAVRLMIETANYACIATCMMGTASTWDRDHAAVGGNMVRLNKLLDCLLDQICKRRGEPTFIFTRLSFEAVVHIRYLIQEFSPALVDSYVKCSLKHERKLHNLIEKNIAQRNGVVLPIEDRMLKSINRTVQAAQIPLDQIEVKGKLSWGGKNIFDKAKAVSLDNAYLAAFGGGSNSIHGNWQEIFGHHLEWHEDTGRFSPKTEWAYPRPQVPLSLCRHVIETLEMYFHFFGGEIADNAFDPALSDLDNRVCEVGFAHENYLASKTWPEI